MTDEELAVISDRVAKANIIKRRMGCLKEALKKVTENETHSIFIHLTRKHLRTSRCLDERDIEGMPACSAINEFPELCGKLQEAISDIIRDFLKFEQEELEKI